MNSIENPLDKAFDDEILRDFAVETLQEKAEKTARYALAAGKCCEKIVDALAYIKDHDAGREPEKSLLFELNKENIYQWFCEAKTNLFFAYWKFADNYFPDMIAAREDRLADKIWEENFKCFDIKAVVSGQLLLVKLPLLWNRYRSVQWRGGRSYPSDKLSWFHWELTHELEKIREQIPQYLLRNISYPHVIPKREQNYPDNDNYDTKQITDTITDFLLGTDAALNCSFSTFSMREGELPIGSYVVVSPSFNRPPGLAEILVDLKRHFSV